MDHEYFMRIAIEEAKKAYIKGEVPIGAVLVVKGEVIAKAHNLRELEQQVLNHAEILVIKEACEKIGFWRLDDSFLYSTVEPCVMCSGAIVQARVENVIYGASDSKNGCCGSKINLVNSGFFNHNANVISGVLAEECGLLMTNFFKELRKNKNSNEDRKCYKKI
ncbi:nucleoside deaminase [Gemella sp. GH3]|uniref:tRNA adenosine(34) deaminase TadA n=1 Tax=unclassified Gemella TaxID=2624949 RepID=UPI0015CFC6BD|nr:MULTISPECIES: tRNA adenosine(34) deaminase TadA [unclassified Gemella]MBF0713152.1 nucleoside deaminase [Gemella sp. GH3.1]NYS50104.1 nucleoside deaminase [Gemella sp. GH3]